MDEVINVEGKILESLPNTLFRIEIEKSDSVPQLIGHVILCHISGKMRMHHVKLMVGDRVKVEMSPKYDLTKGRIIFRLK